ncbi:Villin-1 [Phytophthora nicotianae]|uniref:Villin-1 n=1 Tax=Phytophthora nicotianae TaxID=4792 RepID=A0A0W8CW68_PHYNI|nr:Villin-1 [Phytophthora nicotianae]
MGEYGELQLTDFVVDEQPSSFLRLTMSRRIKDKTIAEPKLIPFLLQLLQSESAADSTTYDADSVVKRVLYGTGSRRVVLLDLCDVPVAEKLRELLHEKPCELLGRRPMYAEFAMPRKEQEARDRLLRVHNVQRNAGPPGLRVPGLRFEAEFITEAQEAACVAFFERENGAHWANTIRARQVQHFGYEFNYDTRRCDPDQPINEPIPEVLQPIIDRIVECGIMDGDRPDQITVNEYLPGQGIAFHTDTHSAFTTTIASLSICSEVVMDFRHPDGVQNEGVLLPARSLAVMSGASRYKWEHAIVPRTFDVIDGKQVPRQRRVSITFRKIRSGPCECSFPKYCDTKEREGQEDAEEEEQDASGAETTSLAPTTVEKQYVHEFYETVAAHFSSTRHSPWPRVAQFVASLPSGSMIADLGCGNGKYMKCVDSSQSFVVGGDRSSRLVNICGHRGLDAMVCDALAVPLRSNSCDAALSIAVLHHLSTLGHRLAAVKEVLRVLRVGGRGIIYAWAHEQMKGSVVASRKEGKTLWCLGTLTSALRSPLKKTLLKLARPAKWRPKRTLARMEKDLVTTSRLRRCKSPWWFRDTATCSNKASWKN